MNWFLIAAGTIAVLVLGALCGVGAFLWARRRTFPAIMTPDGRRAWAFVAILGGCIVFTVFAAVGVWMVRDHPQFTLILAICAHLQILVGMTAMGFVLGRRMQVSGGRDGVVISDAGSDTALGARVAAGAAAGAAEALEPRPASQTNGEPE